MNELKKLFDEHVPGWRKDVPCPVCKKKVHPLTVRRHLLNVHGVQLRQCEPKS